MSNRHRSLERDFKDFLERNSKLTTAKSVTSSGIQTFNFSVVSFILHNRILIILQCLTVFLTVDCNFKRCLLTTKYLNNTVLLKRQALPTSLKAMIILFFQEPREAVLTTWSVK